VVRARWVGGGNFFSEGTTTYLADYIAGAKSEHGLDLNYVGCRNEKGIDENSLEMWTLDQVQWGWEISSDKGETQEFVSNCFSVSSN
jgi:hypothetical protein